MAGAHPFWSTACEHFPYLVVVLLGFHPKAGDPKLRPAVCPDTAGFKRTQLHANSSFCSTLLGKSYIGDVPLGSSWFLRPRQTAEILDARDTLMVVEPSKLHVLHCISEHTITMVFCAYCGKSFTRKEHLERHIPSHTNVKPHRCSACQLSFARRDLLQRHHSTYHEARDPMEPLPGGVPTSALLAVRREELAVRSQIRAKIVQGSC
ncbi:Transcription factor 1 like protein [Verticillium longisporum]|nr:Transcription factor 1 like protein [Verticillium longisporum]